MKHILLLCILLPLCMKISLAQPIGFELVQNSGIAKDLGGAFSASWGDFNNDGCIDLFIVNGNWPESNEPNQLFRNNCDGSFSAYSLPVFALDRFKSTNAAWGDYDQDGWMDLMVGNAANQSINLYHNDRNGGFDQVITDPILNTRGNHKVFWMDYNEDGWLDIYMANENGPDKLLAHNGTINWRDCYSHVNPPFQNHKGNTRGMTFGDIDNDGDLDVLHTSKQNNSLYINEGQGRYRFDGESVVSFDGTHSSSSIFADFDNDHDLDLLVATDKYPNNTLLYENVGNGEFKQITEGVLVNDRPNTYGVRAADFDNDGDLDLFLSCSFGQGGRPNAYYENVGGLNFQFRNLGDITSNRYATAGLACEDFDNDGDQDIFLCNLQRNQNSFLYRNTGNTNHWINLHLVDDQDSLTVWGARIEMKANLNGQSQWQYRQLAPAGAYGQSSLDITFGLANSSIIDSLRIIWPNGDSCIFTQLEADQFLNVFSSCRDEYLREEQLVVEVEPETDSLDQNPPPDSIPVVATVEADPTPTIKPKKKPSLVVIKEPRQGQTIKLSSKSIRIAIWDDDLPDGDIVSIKVGKKMVVSEQLASKKRAYFRTQLPSNEAQLEMIAVTEGKIPPNTAVIMIDDGQTKHKIYMKATRKESGKIRLRLEP